MHKSSAKATYESDKGDQIPVIPSVHTSPARHFLESLKKHTSPLELIHFPHTSDRRDPWETQQFVRSVRFSGMVTGASGRRSRSHTTMAHPVAPVRL